MIPQKQQKHHNWQQELISAIKTVKELLEFCNLADSDVNYDKKAHQTFKFFITKSWANRIEKNNPNDPLLLQILPTVDELTIADGYQKDPLEEKQQSPTNGIIHKYHGRVLLTLTGQCAIYCRYCFRRNYPYSTNSFNQANWQKAITYIKSNPEIYEVILSGGDPLILQDHILGDIVDTLSNIPHIKYLRIHSRIPSVLPNRISMGLINAISNNNIKTTIVTHINHPNEIVAEVSEKFAMLRKNDIMLLNQSVLLANVNDRAETLAELSHKLYSVNCMPYYLHRLDKVEGSQHFYVSPEKEQSIMCKLLATLPGYLVPKLVVEMPHKKAKTPVSINF